MCMHISLQNWKENINGKYPHIFTANNTNNINNSYTSSMASYKTLSYRRETALQGTL